MPECACGHFVCVCNILNSHKSDCSFRISSTCAISIECEHGFGVCSICDPCTCGAGIKISDFSDEINEI